jgi:hypothetical protein
MGGGGRGMLSSACPCCRQPVQWCQPLSSPRFQSGDLLKGGREFTGQVCHTYLDVLLGRVTIEVSTGINEVLTSYQN